MASLVRQASGHKIIQFREADGARRSIRLGTIDVRTAETIKNRVESVITAKATGTGLDGETARWLGSIDGRLHARLAATGLVAPRESAAVVAAPTLGHLLATFFETLSVKSGTRTTYLQTRKSLEEHFGAGRTLNDISELDAERFRQALKAGGLAEATISKRIKVARQVFKRAVRWKMAPANPFQDVRAGSQTNKSRMFFVTREMIDKAMDACPDAEWRLILALSRYGGLRCPSEHLALRWRDIDWDRGRVTVWSPKTEGKEGHEYRVMPLFPELRIYLEEAFEQAEDGAEHMITRYRDPSCNLRTQLLRILARAGVRPWPKLFHNLRSTRQTELTETYPTHVVCDWLGNSAAVALNHYLQVTDKHLADAATRPSGAMPSSSATPSRGQRAAKSAAA